MSACVRTHIYICAYQIIVNAYIRTCHISNAIIIDWTTVYVVNGRANRRCAVYNTGCI